MRISVGAVLGPYEITALLGKGGMGEVYRARDSKLKRDVAIKVLSQEFVGDPERISRFQREAEVVASLNHPNVGAIYDIQEHSGFRFLILELVLGETLAERLLRGPVRVEDALNIAKQICEALEAAHEKGIVHRDLKPANIKIQPDGTVKVLDFGLAKALNRSSANASISNLPTIDVTNAGVIMGTAAYMSPEQARGLDVDHRSDVFALGCVLYEMLTGKPGFRGDTISDVLAGVLKADPEWNLLPARLNPKVRDLLRRCLDKDPKRRWHAVADLRLEIEAAFAGPQDGSVLEQPFAARPLWKRAIPAVVAMLFGGLAVGVATWILRPALSPAVITQFTFALGEGQVFTNTGRNVIAMSPDGTQIVYVANLRLYLRRLGGLEARVIPGSEDPSGIVNPVFSPDGVSIAFYSIADNALKRIPAGGGAPVSLCPATLPFGMNWGGDGILFAQGSGGIMRVSANGGKPEALVTLKSDESASSPQMLPGGRVVLFSLATGKDPDRWDKARVALQTIGSNERKILVEGGSDGRYLPTGQIVYAFSGTLRAVPFNLRTMEVTGGPVSVVEGVRRGGSATGVAHFAFSSNGSLAYVSGPVAASTGSFDLAQLDREGHLESLNLQAGPYSSPRVSPDGKQVALQTDDGKDSIIWIYDLSGGTSKRRLTFEGKNRFPVWSPDGKQVAFQSDREGDHAIFQQRADGSGKAERLTKPDSDTSDVPDAWSSDGNTLLFEARKGPSGSMWALSFRDKKVTPFGNVKSSHPMNAGFSPDGHWVAYTSNETGKDDVFVQPFPTTGAKYQIPEDSFLPLWSPGGKELFYVSGPSRFSAVRINAQPTFAIGNAVNVFRGTTDNSPFDVSRNFDVMPDGKHILVILPADSAPQVHVILNWFSDLQQRVPVK